GAARHGPPARLLGRARGAVPGRGLEHRALLPRVRAREAALPRARDRIGARARRRGLPAAREPVHGTERAALVPERFHHRGGARAAMSARALWVCALLLA